MRKIAGIILAAVLMLAFAGCSKTEAPSQGGAAVDSEGNAIAGTTIDGAGKEVDMEKVEGEELKSVEATDENADASGTIGAFGVSVDNAKLLTTEDGQMVVVTFTFKNKSSELIAFDNVMTVDVTQNDNELRATVVTGYEGINILSAVEQIASGKSTTVQKVYAVTDPEAPINVTVSQYAQPELGQVIKTFNLK